MPPWQPEQLNADGLSPVGEKMAAPQPSIRFCMPSVAPACRAGSRTPVQREPDDEDDQEQHAHQLDTLRERRPSRISSS